MLQSDDNPKCVPTASMDLRLFCRRGYYSLTMMPDVGSSVMVSPLGVRL